MLTGGAARFEKVSVSSMPLAADSLSGLYDIGAAQVERYLGQERTIILAVVPSNQDVATVDILERAKRVDPEGDRSEENKHWIVSSLAGQRLAFAEMRLADKQRKTP
jgi:hypothetical protein